VLGFIIIRNRTPGTIARITLPKSYPVPVVYRTTAIVEFASTTQQSRTAVGTCPQGMKPESFFDGSRGDEPQELVVFNAKRSAATAMSRGSNYLFHTSLIGQSKRRLRRKQITRKIRASPKMPWKQLPIGLRRKQITRKIASSTKCVGRFRLRKSPEFVIQRGFYDFVVLKSPGFSNGQFNVGVKSLNAT
jgi:hypothetical protein